MKTRVEQLRDEGRFRVPLDQQYPELARREQAQALRAMLAAANHYCDVYCNSMNSAAIETAHDAMIAAAKAQAKGLQAHALMTEGAQKIDELRSLLAECVNDWREEIEQWRTAGQPHYAMALERCARDIAMRQEAIK